MDGALLSTILGFGPFFIQNSQPVFLFKMSHNTCVAEQEVGGEVVTPEKTHVWELKQAA